MLDKLHAGMILSNDNGSRVEEGMSVYELKKYGNSKQKLLATIYDFDCDGKYDASEAAAFNNEEVSIWGTKITRYQVAPDGSGIKSKICEVDLCEYQKEYDAKIAEAQNKKQKETEKKTKMLSQYGLGNIGMYDSFIEDDVQSVRTKNINGIENIVIETEDMTIEIPMDENFEPEKVKIGLYESVRAFEGFRGTVKSKVVDDGWNHLGYEFENSDCSLVCADSISESVYYHNSRVKVSKANSSSDSDEKFDAIRSKFYRSLSEKEVLDNRISKLRPELYKELEKNDELFESVYKYYLENK